MASGGQFVVAPDMPLWSCLSWWAPDVPAEASGAQQSSVHRGCRGSVGL